MWFSLARPSEEEEWVPPGCEDLLGEVRVLPLSLHNLSTSEHDGVRPPRSHRTVLHRVLVHQVSDVVWDREGKVNKRCTTKLVEVFGGFSRLPSCLPIPAWMYVYFSPLKWMRIP